MTLESQVQTYFEKLEADPGDSGAMTRLEQLYGAQDQWGELVAELHERAQAAESALVAGRLLLESGRIARHPAR